jgi:signal transduction histidine kinase
MAWRADPTNLTGKLLVAVGISWYLGDLQASANPVLFGIGFCLFHLAGVVFAHLLLALPNGRLERTSRRVIIGLTYVCTVVIQVIRFVVEYPPQPQGWGDPSASYSTWATVGSAFAICTTIAIIALVIHRWCVIDASIRRSHVAVLTTIGVSTIITFVSVSLAVVDAPLRMQQMFMLAYALSLIATPIAIRSGVLRLRLDRLATENALLHETQTKYIDEVAASRARVYEAADAERRRIQRDLHDGAQHRLLSVAMLIDRAVGGGSSNDDELGESLMLARHHLRQTVKELRDLAHGIYPAVLTEQGLAAAVEALAERSPLPVRCSIPHQRWAPRLEHALYFVISELIANVCKHADATETSVGISFEFDESLRSGSSSSWMLLSVQDNGVGGADVTTGSGLRGLMERLESVGGTMQLDSPHGDGTRVIVRVPCVL